jgi:PHD/YefM family antitoxin component YafN of YafNO toxin-antitoxin module
MFELTQNQRQELNSPEPVAIDPETREEYVLVRKEAYERLKSLLDDETIYPTAEHVDRIMAEDDANDPYLHTYQ